MIGPLITLVVSLATLAFVIHNERWMRRHQREMKRLTRENRADLFHIRVMLSARERRLIQRGGGRYPRSPGPHP